jgi:hypothetical protein
MQQTYKLTIDESIADKILWLLNSLKENISIEKVETERDNSFLSSLSQEKQIEAKEIISSIQNGLNDVKNGKIHSIETLWDKLDD